MSAPILVRRFLLRAPLAPYEATSHPLLALAVELARPGLHDGAARARYETRARFRATPAGLLAGVAVGRLGPATRIATGEPEPRVTVSFTRLATLARALLDDARVRRASRLRVAPSLLRHGDHALWLSPRGDAMEAVVDEDLSRVLAGAEDWTAWADVGAPDELLLELVDDGLLVSDLVPPLVGPPPLEWMLARLPPGKIRSRLARAGDAAQAGRLAAARAALAGLPGEGDLAATLVFPRARVILDEAEVARAAALAPLLVRLAAACAPPIAERHLDPTIDEAVAAAAELCGPGSYDLAALALGGYGVRPGAPPRSGAASLLPWMLDSLDEDELALSSGELDALLPPAPLPDTVELMLAPCASGWLLGLHAPAGATWGRFAHALGQPGARLLGELARVEPPGRLDVVFSPGAELGDLAAHPPLRRAALALSGWPAGRAVVPAELGLSHAGLAGGVPSPLSRLRSTLAPPGVYQLLAGWSLLRQHAPWALAWGALAGRARLPRVRLDGFVIAPASWRLPAPGEDLAEWRRRGRVPRHVQVGHEDELMLVDLERSSAGELARLGGRAHEVWPPLDDLVDASGRRVEAVVAVVLSRQAPPAAPRRAPPPAEEPPAPGWVTHRIYGPPDRQDRVLLEAVAPAVAAARAAGAIDAWFFVRYVDGARHHLRVRARGRLGDALAEALAPAVAAGDVVAVETGPYRRETARYGRAQRDVEALFQADSDLACALLALPDDAEELALRRVDALAAALGLPLDERATLAVQLRAAHEPFPPEAAADFRRRARRLRDALSGKLDDDAARLLAVAPRAGKLPRELVPILVHLAVNRLLGTDEAQEGRVAYLWQRVLEGLVASR